MAYILGVIGKSERPADVQRDRGLRPQCVCGTRSVDLRHPDDFFAAMLANENANMIEQLRGVFWFQVDYIR